jgi:hypothetical protein
MFDTKARFRFCQPASDATLGVERNREQPESRRE